MLLRPLLALLALTAAPLLAAVPAKEEVREQRSFVVNGAKEVWRLIWRGTPNDGSDCGPADPAMAMTCPCSGVAYAQAGDLVLERERPGAPSERMALTPLFAGSDMLGPVAMLPRWPAHPGDIDDTPTPATIRARPAVPIMRLQDYNHDGIAGEFLLQIDTLPCGKQMMVAVGITRDNPHLHAMASAEHPERPLVLNRSQWQALARSPRPRKVMDVPCGDHGAEEQSVMALGADRGRIHATRIISTCPDTKRVLEREVM